MSEDQLTFTNPVTRYPAIRPPKQSQPEPGLDRDLEPQADHGEDTYRGTGRLEGRKALITGADSGIGAGVTIAFAREGADIAMAYLPVEEPDATRIAGFAHDAGRTVAKLPGDLTDKNYCVGLPQAAADALGGLDIVVNNASRQIYVENLEDLEDEQWLNTFDANVTAMFRVTKAALPLLKPGASIINTTSIVAYKSSPGLVDYVATKAAISAFTRAVGAQLAPRGIRVNCVAPGPIWTPLQPSHGKAQEDLVEFGLDTPLGRAGQPTEVAPAFVFLASSESSYVTGSTVSVTGGGFTP